MSHESPLLPESTEPLELEGAPSKLERPLLGPRLALFLASLLTALGLYWLYTVAAQAIGAMSSYKPLFLVAYIVMLLLCFWASEVYRAGLTGKELVLVAFWPIMAFPGVRRRIASAKMRGLRRVLVNENWAFCLGENGALLLIYLCAKGKLGAMHVDTGLTLPALFVWALGMIVYFWVSQSWRDGLTVKELVLVALWPVDMFVTMVQEAKYLRSF